MNEKERKLERRFRRRNLRSSIGVICELEIDFFSVIFLSSNDTMISTGMNLRGHV